MIPVDGAIGWVIAAQLQQLVQRPLPPARAIPAFLDPLLPIVPVPSSLATLGHILRTVLVEGLGQRQYST